MEGRLRMEERDAAVGSVFSASLLVFFSSGSRQILGF